MPYLHSSGFLSILRIASMWQGYQLQRRVRRLRTFHPSLHGVTSLLWHKVPCSLAKSTLINWQLALVVAEVLMASHIRFLTPNISLEALLAAPPSASLQVWCHFL